MGILNTYTYKGRERSLSKKKETEIKMGLGGVKKERTREKQRERQTERQTDRQRERERERVSE